MPLSGWFWARGLFLLAVACNAAWVFRGASRWNGLLVIAGGFAAVVAGLLVFTDAAGAGSDSARDCHREDPDDLWLEVGSRELKVRGESLTGAARRAAGFRNLGVSHLERPH